MYIVRYYDNNIIIIFLKLIEFKFIDFRILATADWIIDINLLIQFFFYSQPHITIVW